MRLAVAIVSAVAIAVLTACDPGMTIRQVHSPGPSASIQQPLSVEIAPANEFIGSRWYVGKARITNLSNTPVTISSCELIAEGTAYQATLGGGDSYPIELAPGESRLGGGFFKLKDPVHEVFKEPAEVLIHYSTSGHKEVLRVIVAGGRFRSNQN